MTVVALASTRSSPGVTSLTVGLAFVWQQLRAEPLLIEADPTGGVIGLRFNLSADPSLATLSSDLRRGYDPARVQNNTLDLHGVRCLLAPVDPLHTSRVLERSAGVLAAELPSFRRPTLIDIGRIWSGSPALPLAEIADNVLLVCRPRVDEVQSMLFGIRLLKSRHCRISLVLVGDRPHHPDEIADLAGVPLAAVIPDDRALAGALGGGIYSKRRFKRSLLWRSISSLGQVLLQAEQPVMAPQPPARLAVPPPLAPAAPAPAQSAPVHPIPGPAAIPATESGSARAEVTAEWPISTGLALAGASPAPVPAHWPPPQPRGGASQPEPLWVEITAPAVWPPQSERPPKPTPSFPPPDNRIRQ